MLATATTKARLLFKRIGQLPYLRIPVIRFWNTYEHLKFVFYVKLNDTSNEWKAPVNPYWIYWIPPEYVEIMSGSSFDFIKYTGRIIDAPWDTDSKPIHEGRYYKRFENVFFNGVSWENINYYNEKIKRIRDGQRKRYLNADELLNKFDSYESLYDEFKSGEYKLQSELAVENKSTGLGDGGRALFPSLTDSTLMRHEIAVNIGRDGTLLRNDGRHRLALAVLAGLDEVPVRIVVRHSEWQQHRDEVARLIEEGIKNGITAEGIHEYVKEEYQKELENINMGIKHPDLKIIFGQYFKNI